MHIWLVNNIALGAILGGLDMGAGARGAFDQSRVDDRRLRLFELQPVIFDLAADFGQKIIKNA